MSSLVKTGKGCGAGSEAERAFKQAETLRGSENRLREEVRRYAAEWVASLRAWDLYGTFTYDQRRPWLENPNSAEGPYVPSVAACRHHIEQYAKALGATIGRNVCLASAVETTKAGWPHAHALLDVGGLHGRELSRGGRLWFQGHGFVRLVRVVPRDAQAISAYVTKYLTKAGAEVDFCGDFTQVKGAKSVVCRPEGRIGPVWRP